MQPSNDRDTVAFDPSGTPVLPFKASEAEMSLHQVSRASFSRQLFRLAQAFQVPGSGVIEAWRFSIQVNFFFLFTSDLKAKSVSKEKYCII